MRAFACVTICLPIHARMSLWECTYARACVRVCVWACLLEYEVKCRGWLKAGKQVQTCVQMIAGLTIAFKGLHGGVRDNVIATSYYIFWCCSLTPYLIWMKLKNIRKSNVWASFWTVCIIYFDMCINVSTCNIVRLYMCVCICMCAHVFWRMM